jgi:hypothetical protein
MMIAGAAAFLDGCDAPHRAAPKTNQVRPVRISDSAGITIIDHGAVAEKQRAAVVPVETGFTASARFRV